MEDTKAGLAALELLESPLVAPTATSEALNQQLLYMNSLLTLNPAVSPTTLNVGQVSKEQISEYQLARMRFHQQLLTQSNLYNTQACNYSQYSGLVKNNASLSSFSRIEQPRYRYLQEEPKPQHSYIGLIAMAILSMPEQKMVLSDIYQHILDHYPYFRNRGPGWRNSIRHNLSLNDCFIKAGRSANGKGHYWAIHPANLEDFKKGDFRRRKAQRKVRKHMGLSVPDDEEDEDSPVPSPLAVIDKSTCHGSLVMPPSTHHTPITTPVNTAAAMLSPTTSLLTQQAFNLFNSLRFTLPASYPLKPPSNAFNESFYKHLIDLNIRHDLQAISRPNNRAQFSIESLLAHHDKPNEPESECEPHCKRKRESPDLDACQNSMGSEVLLSADWCTPNHLDNSTESPNSQPVNLKIN